jgi:hypothetical protein
MVYKSLQTKLFGNRVVFFLEALQRLGSRQCGEFRVDHKAIRSLVTTVVVGLSAASCGAAHGNVENPSAVPQTAAATGGKSVSNEQLPINQRFRSLDDYLAWLKETQAPVDGPWYKEIRSGVYELQTGNLHLDVPSTEQRVFTREELEKKFGFSR